MPRRPLKSEEIKPEEVKPEGVMPEVGSAIPIPILKPSGFSLDGFRSNARPASAASRPYWGLCRLSASRMRRISSGSIPMRAHTGRTSCASCTCRPRACGRFAPSPDPRRPRVRIFAGREIIRHRLALATKP